MSKDRAAPFSRKHRKYWIPITGGMIVIGIINVAIGLCTYNPSETHQRIIPVIPAATPVPVAPPRAVPCPVTAEVTAQIAGTITSCTAAADGYAVTIVRSSDSRVVEVAWSGNSIDQIAEPLKLPEIPTPVMRAFAITFPKTIPARATKRTHPGAEPTYELAFPPRREHALATFRPDGTLIETR